MSRMQRGKSFSVDDDRAFVLGIDIGTTSVKVCAVETSSREIIIEHTKETQANVPSEFGSEGNKQNVSKICSTLHACMARFPKELLKRVVSIGISGQMHGIMLWKSGDVWDQSLQLANMQTSNLYTWQDSRCSKEFLESLPTPDSHLKINSGYGCTTLFWMSKNAPEKIEKFDRAGTIQDFVVANLCKLDHPVMSVQNAASWGFFNTQKCEWNYEILKKFQFPVHLLPKVIKAGEIAGKTHIPWHGVPHNVPVVGALGDFQSSVYSKLHSDDTAILNISTSCQLAYIVQKPDFEENLDKGHIEYFPYFDGKYLAVAASLTGGNSLQAFVQMIQQWSQILGCNLPQSKIWEKILEAGAKEKQLEAKHSLLINPTIFGERHEPEMKASVSNIDLGNLSLGHVTRALCRGIIKNLHEMMPSSMLTEAGILRVVGSGSALIRNPIIQEEFIDIFKLPTDFSEVGDSAYGAAIVCLRNLSKNNIKE